MNRILVAVVGVVVVAQLAQCFTDYDHSVAYDRYKLGNDLDTAPEDIRTLCTEEFRPFSKRPTLEVFAPKRYITYGKETLCLPSIFNGTDRFNLLGFVDWSVAKTYVDKQILDDFEPLLQTDNPDRVLALMNFAPLVKGLSGEVDYSMFTLMICLEVAGTGRTVDHAESLDVLGLSESARWFRLTTITPDKDFAEIINNLFDENYETGTVTVDVGASTTTLSARYSGSSTDDISISVYMGDLGSSVDSIRVAQHVLSVMQAVPTISGHVYYNLGVDFYQYDSADYDSDDKVTYGNSQKARRLKSLGFEGGLVSRTSSFIILPPNAYPLLEGLTVGGTFNLL